MHKLPFLVALLAYGFGTLAQTASGEWKCVPATGITDLPACDNLFTTWQVCNGTANDQEYRQCLCKQSFIDDMINCKSEARLCYQSEVDDDRISTLLTNWHSVCDSHTTFTPTSPVLSTLTTTFVLPAPSNQAWCNNQGADACEALSVSAAECLQINTAATGADFLNCACQDKFLSLASVCLYDAGRTCMSRTVTLSEIPWYTICSTMFSSGSLVPLTNLTPKSSMITSTPTSSQTVTSAAPTSAKAQSPASLTPVPTSTTPPAVSASNITAISSYTGSAGLMLQMRSVEVIVGVLALLALMDIL